ncbi:hypothetical protein [Microbacterium dauci]|uniref:Uncharacterized protein n=1 Tax=Microbacterium dauci TaxID=3048008 RepID=A0ABT6ZD22_9MICO|nr:hypothetical protein [Microbacterium sp. LX3-4]MDJ1113833.1 hypothetical protein [Microbacterium sp. LX3-4]
MTSSTPRRRHSPAVYRRRRLAVVLVALLLVGGVVAVVIWQPWRAWADAALAERPGASPSASASAPAGSTPIPTSPAPEEPSPTPTADAVDEDEDAVEVLPCTTGDVTVTAKVDKGSYGTDQFPHLSIQLVNDTEFPCLINVGTTAQTFEITSGSDVWWRSTDCQSEPSDQVVQLGAGQTVSSSTPLVWDRTRSSVDTCEGSRQNALPGWYNLTVSIGGIESVEPAQFTIR